MSIEILKKLKTKLLLRDEYIDILKSKGYKDIYIVSTYKMKLFSSVPKTSLEYIYNQEIHTRYELLVNGITTIYLYEVKKGIHLNGDFDYREVIIVGEDNIELYRNLEQNHTNIKAKKR